MAKPVCPVGVDTWHGNDPGADWEMDDGTIQYLRLSEVYKLQGWKKCPECGHDVTEESLRRYGCGFTPCTMAGK